MAAAMFSNTVLASKFRGCMIGALLGDCLGFPFEDDMSITERTVNNFLTDLIRGNKVSFLGSSEVLMYTDDTSMTLSITSSLIEKGEVDANDIAKKFVDEYYRDIIMSYKRGYGLHVVDVFKALRDTNYKDVFAPAKLQFGGSGSYGNGAAMRTAPIALFGNNKGEQFIVNAAKECSCITHTHPNGYNGAILQSLAVNAALELDSSQVLDPVHFINNLQEKMERIETQDLKKPYCESLEKIKNIYKKQNPDDISPEIIAKYLGNNITALGSVPTAIYSFLRGMKPLKNYESSNPFLRTLYFAISVKGDTDTIATMAGAIAGAYYGEDVMPEVLQKRCASTHEVIKLADKLFEVTQKKGVV